MAAWLSSGMSLFGNKPAADRALFDAASSRWWTFGELAEEIQRWAARLSTPHKSLAFCFARNDVHCVSAYLGALEAGCAIALLPDNLHEEFQARLIGAYEPDFLYEGSAKTDYASEVFAGAYQADATAPGFWRRGRPAAAPVHTDLALMLSTSGSTGSPKCVRLTAANVRANAHSIADALRITPSSCAVASLPIHYSYGLSVLNSYLVSGAPVVLTDEGLMSTGLWNLVREHQCDSFAGVPYSYQILDRLGLDRLKAPSLRTLTQAGGKLNPELIAKFHHAISQRGGQFFTMYGQTEATARIAVLPPEQLPAKVGSVGFAIPGGSIAIESLDGQPAETGEIVYRGPNVMMGYAETRADLAQGDVLQGVLHTGDLGRLDEDGCLWVTGRLKREAKLFGLRVNLDELESMVRVHGPAAIISGADRLRIYCEFDESLFAACRDELSSKLRIHSQAFEFRRVDRIPTNASGKIDYAALEPRS